MTLTPLSTGHRPYPQPSRAALLTSLTLSPAHRHRLFAASCLPGLPQVPQCPWTCSQRRVCVLLCPLEPLPLPTVEDPNASHKALPLPSAFDSSTPTTSTLLGRLCFGSTAATVVGDFCPGSFSSLDYLSLVMPITRSGPQESLLLSSLVKVRIYLLPLCSAFPQALPLPWAG